MTQIPLLRDFLDEKEGAKKLFHVINDFAYVLYASVHSVVNLKGYKYWDSSPDFKKLFNGGVSTKKILVVGIQKIKNEEIFALEADVTKEDVPPEHSVKLDSAVLIKKRIAPQRESFLRMLEVATKGKNESEIPLAKQLFIFLRMYATGKFDEIGPGPYAYKFFETQEFGDDEKTKEEVMWLLIWTK